MVIEHIWLNCSILDYRKKDADRRAISYPAFSHKNLEWVMNNLKSSADLE
jgi:hypothetical protein